MRCSIQSISSADSRGSSLSQKHKTRSAKVSPTHRGKPNNGKPSDGKVSDLEDLLRINSELGIRRDLNKALLIYVKRAAAFMRFHRAFLGIVEDGKCLIRYAVNHGKSVQYNFALDRGMTFNVIEKKKPFVTENVAQ